MQKFNKIGSGVLLGGMVFLLFLVLFEAFIQVPDWLAVGGRMHPMFLHFPIVLLLLSFFTVWVPVSQSDNEWLGVLRLSAALSAMITAIMGMLLSMEDGRSGTVLQLHKWGGIIIAVLGYLFYAYYPLLTRHVVATRSFTLLAAIVIIVTGHWGADLTHGADYVLGPIKKNEPRRIAAPEEAIVFADVIQPIFEKKCSGCHSESSLKGELLLQSLAGLQKGGKSGPLYIPGQPDTSLLIRRIHLPLEDKKRMPPASKPQLTAAEENILYNWVKSGAVTDAKLFSLPVTDSFRLLATNMLQQMVNEPAAPVYNFEAINEKKVAALNSNYRTIMPLGKNSPALAVDLFGRNIYTSKQLEEILPLKKQIVQLNAARLPIKDEDMKFIQQFENLRKLNLNYTDITDKAIDQLLQLKNLQEITLSGTAITKVAFEKIVKMPAITALYAWDTKADTNQINMLKKQFPAVYIETGFTSSGDDKLALSPPVIKTPAGVFDKNTMLELKHPFKGVEIRYTLDGSLPDSINSPVYSAPIAIDKNTTLTAQAFKPGWYGSTTVQASFIRKGIPPDSIILIHPSDARYNPPSEKTLIDGELGSFDNVANGDWFGYQKTDAAYIFLFNEPVPVQSVMVMAAKNVGRHIFPPQTVEVWGGMDQKELKLLGKIKPAQPVNGDFSKLLELVVDFPETRLKCLKVVATPVASLPEWHGSKGKPGWVFVSEVVVD